ncbi:hypothetical protein RM780_07625 [Streptomyces sp. DSM 44917]|uniref:Uncharacterized protein n=1 Tax=Streptomyces boetiae TaxID=3075541 RepID=A0ABU2L5I5_9ACTN|nr:hypothetical protein [Streptomyces sp. DSM 44917]MDT0306831.1 hypothetical protein [Streptomyces sp. DSM 44917]
MNEPTQHLSGTAPAPSAPDDPLAGPTMTVRVCDRGSGRDYVGVTIRTVTISAHCPTCGGPRGAAAGHRFCEDGAWYAVDRWDNPCGHIDYYSAVLAEAAARDAVAAERAAAAEETRARLVAAIAATSRIIAQSPAAPSSLAIEAAGLHPQLKLYFHNNADAVTEFAEHFGGTASARPHTDRPDSSIYTSATGELDGVRYEAWSLTAPQADEAGTETDR